jgi:hydroxymethylglutaryl-CoA reductase (NADPH)
MPGAPCFTDFISLTARSSILTLSFVPGSSDDFTNAIKRQAHFTEDKFGVKYHVEGRQAETIGEMRSGKWVVIAARALVVRFWDLAKVCCFYILSRLLTLTTRPYAESRLT